ncbi:hypothetical protein PT285_11225 [Lactobacillus sp. ESL0791]|uniref:hypothetical protein n=1 Tax=Lactobacillus sp. ESL0791 TaxID=2983234 RepID=UPI0023F7CB49|nr:hypothetical protein [Lactobacillus sp. ESL0791]MDF7639973.1 hypothetical protein [Lactobacillus sp. ESL0791]
MKSISQINQEKDTCSLISAFTKLIDLADLSKKVNFKRHSLVSLLMVINWMIQSRFARFSFRKSIGLPVIGIERSQGANYKRGRPNNKQIY